MIGLLVALAGGLGAVVRFLVDAAVGGRARRFGMPLGTVVVNVTGSFLLGLLTGWWATHTADPGVRLVLGTGFLGGYTTFSTASYETVKLAGEGRWVASAVNGLGVLVLAVLAAGCGLALTS